TSRRPPGATLFPYTTLFRSLLLLQSGAAWANAAPPKLKLLQTPSGVRFGVLGDKAAKPAPTLFIFAGSLEDALNQADYNKAGLRSEEHTSELQSRFDIVCRL